MLNEESSNRKSLVSVEYQLKYKVHDLSVQHQKLLIDITHELPPASSNKIHPFKCSNSTCEPFGITHEQHEAAGEMVRGEHERNEIKLEKQKQSIIKSN
jgi:hypothetical protein